MPYKIYYCSSYVQLGGGGGAALMWIKLIVLHFLLWVTSTVGTSQLFRLLDKKLSNTGNTMTPGSTNLGTSSTSPSTTTTTTLPSSSSVPSSSSHLPSLAAEEKLKKQLQLLKFWGGVTAAFYAAPAVGRPIVNSNIWL